jgi:hypothetical protein
VLEDKAKSAQAIELINGFDLRKDFNYTGASRGTGAAAGTGTSTGSASGTTGDKGRLKDVNVDRYKGLLD